MSKNKYRRIISIIIMVILSINLFNGMKIPVKAETFSGTCGENLVWELDDSTGILTISGSGVMEDYEDVSSPLTDFEDCPGWIQTRKSIKKIIISEGVTSIGNYAFKLRRSVNEVILPKSLKRIGVEAFYDNRSLENISLPNSVSIIDDGAFYICSALKKIEIPANVKKIGSSCFVGTGLEEVTLNEGLKEIGYGAFSGTNIQKVIIPVSVEKFGGDVFDNCENLEYVKLGKNIKEMNPSGFAMGNFRKCPLLKTAGPDDSYNIKYTWKDEIPDEAFAYLENLEKVDIGNNIKQIGEGAFFGCSSLKKVNFSGGLQTIGASAFRRCENLNGFILPSSIESIGQYAFISSGESEIIVPESVNKIGSAAIGYIATFGGKGEVGKDNTVPVKKDNYIIRGYVGSAAEKYAIENDITFEKLDKENEKPSGTISSTNNVDSKQTVTLSLQSNGGIAGYYWGTNSNYSNNTYTANSSGSVTKAISSNGTYYLTVKDANGNVSDTVSATFYKTTLNANGGSVSPSYVITKRGNSFTLPIPTRNGYSFNGWSSSSSDTSGNITRVNPTSNSSYYATWNVKKSEFKWGVDNWNFDNTSRYFKNYNVNQNVMNLMKEDFGLSNSDIYELQNNIYNSNMSGFCGSCFGMTISEIFAKQGDIKLSRYGGNDIVNSNTNSLNMTSVINFIQELQGVSRFGQILRQSSFIQGEYSHTQKDFVDKLKTVLENEGCLVKLSYGIKKRNKNTGEATSDGNHAVLAYGIENCNYYSNVTGKTYDKKVLIADPNYLSGNAIEDEACLYYNSSDYSWIVPYWCTTTSTYVRMCYWNASSGNTLNTGALRNIIKYNSLTDTVDLMADYSVSHYIAGIDLYNYSGNQTNIVQVKDSGSPSLDYAGESGTGISRYDIEADDSININENEEFYALWNPTANYEINYSKLSDYKVKMDYEDIDYYIDVNNSHYTLVKPSGYIEVRGADISYNITMVTDESQSITDWYALGIKDDNAENIKFSKNKNGYILSGSDLKGVTISAKSDTSETTTTLNTNYDTVLIYETDKNDIGIMADSDGDGVYDKIIGQGQNQPEETTKTEKVTTSEKSTNELQTSKVNETTAKSNITVTNKKVSRVKKIKAKKKSLKITWKKVKGVKGYQIEYSLKQSFKKSRIVTITKGAASSKTIKKLKAKKKYFVRVRTYIVSDGRKIYSKWSKAKSKKTK